eukprot:2031315-Lingulodinium_polyedra.AAC.1
MCIRDRPWPVGRPVGKKGRGQGPRCGRWAAKPPAEVPGSPSRAPCRPSPVCGPLQVPWVVGRGPPTACRT